jgi:hypothetical protein
MHIALLPPAQVRSLLPRVAPAALLAVSIGVALHAGVARADDPAGALGALAGTDASGSGDSKDGGAISTATDVLKNLGDLENADNAQAQMEAGFAMSETFAGLLGPEAVLGLKGLQQVVELSGIFSSGASNATTAALAAITARVEGLAQDIQLLQSAQSATAAVVAAQDNRTLHKSVDDARRALALETHRLFPQTAANAALRSQAASANFVAHAGGVGKLPPGVTATPDVAEDVAFHVGTLMDAFIDDEDSYFLGDDLQTVSDGNGHTVKVPVPGLKPHPGLNVYLSALQAYVGALEVISGGTPSGYARILSDRGTPDRPAYVAELRKHIAFLRSAAQGGRDPGKDLPMQDRIAGLENCVWQVSGHLGGTGNGQCSAGIYCTDGIAHRRIYTRVGGTWRQSADAACQIDPEGQALDGGGTSGDRIEPLVAGMRNQYGVLAMNRMADILERVARYGTALQRTGYAGSLGVSDPAQFFAYGIGAMGAVKTWTGTSKGLAKPGNGGFLAGTTALLPAGGAAFYALTKDGRLQWVEFTGSASGSPQNGPRPAGSGFGGYSGVLGAGDGVVYAIQSDGTLLWTRQPGFQTGSGAMPAPRPINAGWNRFKTVFSGGHGVLYGVQPDGTLVWYRHVDYLTGDSRSPASTPPPAARPGPTVRSTAARDAIGAGDRARVVENAATAHFEGPFEIAKGFGDYRRLIATGDGVILAVRADGSLSWYRHADFLTGVSTDHAAGGAAAPSAAPGAAAGWGTAPAGTARTGTMREVTSPSATNDGGLAGKWGSLPTTGNAGAASPPRTGAWERAPSQPMYAPIAALPPSTGASRVRRTTAGAAEMPTGADGTTITTGGAPPSGRGRTGASTAGTTARDPVNAHAHLTGPFLIDAHSGWEALDAIAVSLPATVADPRIK